MKQYPNSEMHISFVILHYQTLNDTISCIDSIREISNEASIVVVDNRSPNGTGIELEKKYEDTSNIHIILSESNEGFSKGNNKGYSYAREVLKSKTIIVMNNDTLIRQEDFIEKLNKIVDSGVDIIGPDIISTIDSRKQNPVPYNFRTKRDITKRILKYRVLRLLVELNLDTVVQRKHTYSNESVKKDYQLHGSCIIFTNRFVESEQFAFNPNVFMYCEEDILKAKAEKASYTMKYDPSVVIYHKEKSSTNSMFGKDKNRRKFYYSNSLKSLKYLKKYLGELNEY